MKILLYVKLYPSLIRGDMLRIHNIFKKLSCKHDVYLLSFKSSYTDQQNSEIKKSGIFKECVYLDLPEPSLLAKGIIISHILLTSKLPFGFGYPKFKRQVEDKVKAIINQKRIDVIHLYSPFMVFLLMDIIEVPKVLDLIDSPSLHHKREAQLSGNPISFFANCCKFIMWRQYERYWIKNGCLTTVVSPVDKQQILKKLNVKANIEVIPNGVDINYFSLHDDVPKISEDYPSILFSGVMNYPPNVDAAIYIYKRILPLMRDQIPEIKYYIVGANPSFKIKNLAKDNQIIVTGFVEDIRQYILRASVIIAPMRKGGGIKNKILEAMALGKPIVTNAMGAEWLDPNDRDCLAVGNTPTEMVQKTVELLNNKPLRENLGERASKLVREKYTWDICSQRYENVYKRSLEQNIEQHRK